MPNNNEEDRVEEAEEEEADGGGGGGYVAFRRAPAARRRRTLRGALLRLSPITDQMRGHVTEYVNGGALMADLQYVRDVYGLVNASGRLRDFDFFWEAPWAQEQEGEDDDNDNDAPPQQAAGRRQRRKVEAQQRAMAARSYIRSTAPTDPAQLNQYLESVERVSEWSERGDGGASKKKRRPHRPSHHHWVKTVSRMVQSFERLTLTRLHTMAESVQHASLRAAFDFMNDQLVGLEPTHDITTQLACTLRRNPRTYHLFAAAVAMEILWNEGTNGTRNTTQYMCQQLQEKRVEAELALLNVIAQTHHTSLRPLDSIGLPLMSVSGRMCVSRGVLVLLPGRTAATYVLDLEDEDGDANGEDLSDVQSITITHVVHADE